MLEPAQAARRRPNWRHLWVLIALLAVITSVGGWMLSRRDARSVSPDARPLPVITAVLTSTDGYELARRYTGLIEARRSSTLSFQRTGRLDSVMIGEGERVAAGQDLAALDVRRLKAQRRQIIAQREAAAAVLTEMTAGPRRQDIAEAKSAVTVFVARHERAKIRLAGVTSARERAAASDDEYVTVLYDEQAAAAELEAARQRLNELEEGTRAEKITAQQATVDEFDARLDVVDIDLADSVIKAPFAGRIGRRLLDEGAIVGAGDPVLRIVETDAVEAWIGVPVAAASRLEPGSRRQLEVAGRTITATVSAVMPQLDAATRTVQVVLTVDQNDAAGLIPGQIARLSLTETVPAAGFRVPVSALVPGRRGLWGVYVLGEPHEDGFLLELADVEVLHTDAHTAFVRGPLTDGQRVVAAGVHRVVPGQVVRPEGR